jgi:hypothetical protein
LHLQEETDPFTQGYIGVAANLEKRLRSHKHRFKELWHKIVVKPLLIAESDYCFSIEEKLRSVKNIGWNKAIGGYRNNTMIGNENPNFGKFGEQAPRFDGWYITPLGRFDRAEDAAKLHNCTLSTIQRKCRGRYINNKYLPAQSGFAFEQKV